ncbi:hypothetical protein L6232_25345, partial [Shewanella sp. C31]|nr:hypothetical protein [Shewanella electrica]
VILNTDMAEWNKLLEEFLGPPAKAANEKPSKEQKKLTGSQGGIDKGQTLFKKESEGNLIVAMLWPWGDGAHTTLKIFQG